MMARMIEAIIAQATCEERGKNGHNSIFSFRWTKKIVQNANIYHNIKIYPLFSLWLPLFHSGVLFSFHGRQESGAAGGWRSEGRISSPGREARAQVRGPRRDEFPRHWPAREPRRRRGFRQVSGLRRDSLRRFARRACLRAASEGGRLSRSFSAARIWRQSSRLARGPAR